MRILTQLRKLINRGKHQPIRDTRLNLGVIPAKKVMLDAVKWHEKYPAVGGRD